MWLKQSYDQGEKCGKLLACHLNKKVRQAVSSIKKPPGDVTSDPLVINNRFLQGLVYI